MKTIQAAFSILFAIASFQIQAQTFQSNNFDTEGTLEILIDSTSADTIWQIGPPQKTILNETSSAPNVLMTDTLSAYPIDTDASFIVEIKNLSMNYWPYIQLEWFYKMDFEDGVDGGIIEVSYDLGQTWSNIFTDTIYRPEIVGAYPWKTLHNHQAGLTGTSELSWMGICWGTAIGTPPSNNLEEVHVRFTMSSDSIDTQQEGWLIDNLNVPTLVIGSTSNRISFKKMSVYPNPGIDEIELNLTEVINEDVDIYIYDNLGKLVYSKKTPMFGEISHKVNVSNLQQGTYYVIVKGEEVQYHQKFVKLE